MKNMEEIKITIDGIIGGIGSPYGEGATYDYNSMGEYSHLDEVDREKLRKDLQVLIDTALAQRDETWKKRIPSLKSVDELREIMGEGINKGDVLPVVYKEGYNRAIRELLSHLQETERK